MFNNLVRREELDRVEKNLEDLFDIVKEIIEKLESLKQPEDTEDSVDKEEETEENVTGSAEHVSPGNYHFNYRGFPWHTAHHHYAPLYTGDVERRIFKERIKALEKKINEHKLEIAELEAEVSRERVTALSLKMINEDMRHKLNRKDMEDKYGS